MTFPDLNQSGRLRICLLMSVRNESAILARCLNTVLEFIDSYVIFDTGSTDGTLDTLRNLLKGKTGVIEQTELPDYASRKRSLYRRIPTTADYGLFVDADETLHCIGSALDTNDADVVLFEVEHNHYSYVQPRMARPGLNLNFSDENSGEIGIPENIDVSTITNSRLFHHQDGIRHRDRDLLSVEYVALRTEYEQKRVAGALLSLAKTASMMNAVSDSRHWLSMDTIADFNTESAWQQRYMLGLSLLDNNELDAAARSLNSAFELDPSRMEPLYRLTTILIAKNELVAALDLSTLARDIPVPDHVGYFERRLYERDVFVQHISILERCGLIREARDLCQDLKKDSDISPGLRTYLDGWIAQKKDSLKERDHTIPDFQTSGDSKPAPLLTIGMATVDDFDGVFFTLMSILVYHREIRSSLELIVLDNNPNGVASQAIERLCNRTGAIYIPKSDYRSTAVRDSIFRYATGDTVLCLDSHVMIMPGALKALLDYQNAHPNSRDLLQGPLVSDNDKTVYTHFEPVWSKGMFGIWGSKNDINESSPPFEIGMQGLGLFACSRKAWPGLNPRFTGFGAEEGYIHEKFRRNGGKVMCLPFLRWVHRFDRPLGPRYEINWRDRIRNYLIGFDELGWETSKVASHFASHIGFQEMARVQHRFLSERSSVFYKFDGIYLLKSSHCEDNDRYLIRMLDNLGLEHRIRTVDSTDTESSIAATVRSVAADAYLHDMSQILIIQEAALLSNDLEERLQAAIDSLSESSWELCLLGLSGTAEDVTDSALQTAIARLPDDLMTSTKDIDQLIASSPGLVLNLRSQVERSARSLIDNGSTGLLQANCSAYYLKPDGAILRDQFTEETAPARFLIP